MNLLRSRHDPGRELSTRGESSGAATHCVDAMPDVGRVLTRLAIERRLGGIVPEDFDAGVSPPRHLH